MRWAAGLLVRVSHTAVFAAARLAGARGLTRSAFGRLQGLKSAQPDQYVTFSSFSTQSYARSASGPAAAGFWRGFWCVTGSSTSFGSTCRGGSCLGPPAAAPLRRRRGGPLRAPLLPAAFPRPPPPPPPAAAPRPAPGAWAPVRGRQTGKHTICRRMLGTCMQRLPDTFFHVHFFLSKKKVRIFFWHQGMAPTRYTDSAPGGAEGRLGGLLVPCRAARSGRIAERGSCSHATAMTSGLRLLNHRAAFCTASMTSPST